MKDIDQVYSREDYTLSIGKANVQSILILIPITGVYLSGYGWIWGWEKFGSDLTILYGQYAMVFTMLFVGIVLHELLHAVVWAAAGRLSLRDFKFGFNVSGLSPYVHCKSPIPVRAYRWGTAAPGVLLGIIPFCLALITGNAFLMSFGFIFTLVAGGDFLMLWMMRNVRPGSFVQDHPERVGFEIVSTDPG